MMQLRVRVTGVNVHAANIVGWHKEWMLKGKTLENANER
jgi:hypothetical protein